MRVERKNLNIQLGYTIHKYTHTHTIPESSFVINKLCLFLSSDFSRFLGEGILAVAVEVGNRV